MAVLPPLLFCGSGSFALKLLPLSRLKLRAGHLPEMGECYPLALIDHGGSTGIRDAVFSEIVHPVSRRLVAKCAESLPRDFTVFNQRRPHAAPAGRTPDSCGAAPLDTGVSGGAIRSNR